MVHLNAWSAEPSLERPAHSAPDSLISMKHLGDPFAQAACALAVSLGCPIVLAGTTSEATSDKSIATEPASENTWMDTLWGVATVHKSGDGILNELSLTGRYQGQFWSADAESGNGSDWDSRRARVGARAYFFERRWEMKAEMFFNMNRGGNLYEGVTEGYIAWHPGDAFNVIIGKQKTKFGWEWTTSSRLIPTFERGALINQFRPDYASGVVIDGKVDRWSYYAGVFSNDTVGEGEEAVDDRVEFGEFGGGWSTIASIGYDFSGALGLRKAQWRLDCIHSERHERDDVFTAFDNGVSTSLELQDGSWGLLTEVLFADGDAANWGLVVIPTYDLTRRLQIVGRYQLGLSDEDTGLSVQRRYEREVGGAGGDMYNAFYAGFQYFLFDGKDVGKRPEQKHRLKLMAGVEYAHMDGRHGYDGWTALAGVRVFW